MSSLSPDQSSLVPEESRWSVSCCPSASSSLTSSTSFAMDSLVSSHSSNTDHLDEPKRSYSACALSLPDTDFRSGFERRPLRPFRSNEEYLVAMKEDLAEWLNTLYTEVDLCVDNFIHRLETGVLLCRHANSVLTQAREWRLKNGYSPFQQLTLSDFDLDRDVPVKSNALPGTFLARDNVANFIDWCRRIRIHECLLFETEDLVARKNEKSVVLCLLEVARYGAKFGLLAPTLVQFEQEIDQELEKEQQQAKHGYDLQAGSLDEGAFQDCTPQQQITNNDLESLHEKVVNLLSRCTCPIQFYLEHLSEGKYRIGDTKTLIFVRILRNHVMVRVGGGWDTLEHLLERMDKCRCRFGHRYSSSARVSLNNAPVKSAQIQVTYERTDHTHSQPRRSMASVNSSPSSVRRLTRPNSVTPNLHSGPDLASVRRASTSSNDSASSMCSSSLTTNASEKCDSLVSSEHSSLSSNHSMSSYSTPVLADRNNNIKGLSNSTVAKLQALPQSKPSPNKKRVLPSTPDNLSRIPKSKQGSAMQLKTSNFPVLPSASKSLSNAYKVKSTSTLAIPQLSSSKIPCLDATNKLRPSSRYSTNNIYLAVSQENDKEKSMKRLSLTPVVPSKQQRSRVPSLSRNKQKSSLELNVSNENFFLSPMSSKPLSEAVPNSKCQKASHQQHRRHHSSSSLPRVTKSAHSSPYAKRRELTGLNSNCGPTGANCASDTNHRHKTVGSKLDSAKRLQGSATSLNSTASTASGSTNSSSSSLNTTVPRTESHEPSQQTSPRQLSQVMGTGGVGSDPFLEPSKSFMIADKKTPSPALVEVCSWLERNHLAS